MTKLDVNRSSAKAISFVIEAHEDNRIAEFFSAYPIIKRTKKYYCIGNASIGEYCPETDSLELDIPLNQERIGWSWSDEQSICRIDREALERTGSAWFEWRRVHLTYWHYVATRGSRGTPECLKALGLPSRATVDQIKRAYRCLSKEKHPDHGGDEKEFAQLHRHFEQATAYARRHLRKASAVYPAAPNVMKQPRRACGGRRRGGRGKGWPT